MNFSKDPNWVSKGNKIWTLKHKNRWKERGREILEWGQTCRIPSPSCSLRNILWIPSHQQLPVGGGRGRTPAAQTQEGDGLPYGGLFPSGQSEARGSGCTANESAAAPPSAVPWCKAPRQPQRERNYPAFLWRTRTVFQSCSEHHSHTGILTSTCCNGCQTRAG